MGDGTTIELSAGAPCAIDYTPAADDATPYAPHARQTPCRVTLELRIVRWHAPTRAMWPLVERHDRPRVRSLPLPRVRRVRLN